jgi:hypothetical protein
LPGENELRTEISTLFKKQTERDAQQRNQATTGRRNKATTGSATSTAVSNGRFKLDPKYGVEFKALLEGTPGMKVAVALALMKEKDNGEFYVVPDGMDEGAFIKKLKIKFNNGKTSLRSD